MNQGSFGEERLVNGIHAIIPEYAMVMSPSGEPVVKNRNAVYTLVFQVWRRSGGGQGTTAWVLYVGW